MTTLAEIVNTALSDSDAKLKLASARDVLPSEDSSLAYLDSELISPTKTAAEAPPFGGDDDKPEGEKKDKEDDKEKRESKKEASRSRVLEQAEYSLKLAQSLTTASQVLTNKFAADGTAHGTPGPAVHKGGHQTGPTIPKAHSTVTDHVSGPPTNAGPGGLPTTKNDFTSVGDHSGRAKNHPSKTAGWTNTKEASARILRAKMAQSEIFMNLGEIDAAESLLKEIQDELAKSAQDPSSPQPSMPAHVSNPGGLDTSPGPNSGKIPDNAGAISITKSQAKDQSLSGVGDLITEPPKKDNAVSAHFGNTHGLKLSSLVLTPKVAAATPQQPAAAPPPAPPAPEPKTASYDTEVGRAYLQKMVSVLNDPEAPQAERTKAASVLKAIKDKIGVQQDHDFLLD